MTTLEKMLQEIEELFSENEESVYDQYGVLKHSIESETALTGIKDIIKNHLSDNDGWIPVEERLPKCEQEVYILTERGTETTALYEDGKMLESKSKWHWNDIQGEWDYEEDSMIIPEGWWEYRHFNPDDVYNNIVDEKVIAWQPLPEPYRKSGE